MDIILSSYIQLDNSCGMFDVGEGRSVHGNERRVTWKVGIISVATV